MTDSVIATDQSPARAPARTGFLYQWGPQAWIDMWMSKKMLVDKAMPIVSHSLLPILRLSGDKDEIDAGYREIRVEHLDGFDTEKVIGLARGNTIRARHVGRDIMAVLRTLVGGEVSEYTKLMAEAREQALDRMKADAERQGANAVVGVRFTTSVVLGGAAELLAYGTAVVVKPD